jgi:hypothetical protein
LYKWAIWLRKPTIYVMIGEAIEPPKPDASQSGARERFTVDLSKAFVALRDEAVSRFSLQPDDLPKTPQERMGRPHR